MVLNFITVVSEIFYQYKALYFDLSHFYTAWLSQYIIPYTEYIPGLVLLLCLLIFSVLEVCMPYFRYSSKRIVISYFSNFITFIFNSSLLTVLSVGSLVVFAQQYSYCGLFWHSRPSAWQSLLMFLLLDLSMYVWHLANHRIGLLWLFHKVHHSDTNMNVSTGLRFHLGELLLTAIYKCFLVIALGITESILFLWQIVTLTAVMFHHSNFSFKGEKLLSYLLIVPMLHRTHHSCERNHYDSNYGSIFSVWDRAFRTLNCGPVTKLGLKNVVKNDFLTMFLFGFGIENQQVTHNKKGAEFVPSTRGFSPETPTNSEKETGNKRPVCEYSVLLGYFCILDYTTSVFRIGDQIIQQNLALQGDLSRKVNAASMNSFVQ